MSQETSAGWLWVGDDASGRQYRIRLIGAGDNRKLLIQMRLSSHGWAECHARRLPPAGQQFLRVMGELCSHALAEPINPAYALRDDETPERPSLDVTGQLYDLPLTV